MQTLRAARWSLGAALMVSTSVALAPAARADAAFTLSASAEGVSVEVSNAGFPLVTSVQANTPTAQATLNSRGQATAYSAAPDPGHGVAELPAVGATQICAILAAYGLKLPGCDAVAPLIPAYPYAYAQTGDAPQDKSFAGAHLHAEAGASESEGQTVVGVSGTGSATSTARTATAPDGSVDATADSVVDVLRIGDLLRIAGVHASAGIHRDPTGKLTPSSSFQIGHLMVNGLQVGYDDGTFVLLGSPVPVPLPVDTVLAAFKAIGITATFLPAIRTDHGVTSEGLMLSYVAPGAPSGVVPPIPLPLPIGVGVPTNPTTVTYVLGRASVDSVYRTIPGLLTGVVGPTALPSAAVGSVPVGTGSSGPAAVAGAAPLPTAGAGLGVAPVPEPSLAPPTGTSGPQTVSASPRAAVTSDPLDIYLAFVVAALAVFGGGMAIRFLGVRLSWTS